MGINPTFGSSSTDANLPMSLGIPAITIDSGLGGGRPHAPDEWIDVDRGRAVSGFHRTLLLLLALADLQ
jgi:di/tripeptidase